MKPVRIAFIGAGNVAGSLVPAIAGLPGVELVQIAARSVESARSLADSIPGCTAVEISGLTSDADIYILSVTDSALYALASQLKPVTEAIWLHTSGSVPAEVLAPLSPKYGVLYPLQTFTRGRRLDMKQIPIFVEGSDGNVTSQVENLAAELSDTVRRADSDIRKRMHVAAVFGCNFVTHMLDIADTLLRRDGLDLSLLTPLIRETMRKTEEIGPHAAQTGPARRGDTAVIEAHEAMLPESLRNMYHLISSSIHDSYEQN